MEEYSAAGFIKYQNTQECARPGHRRGRRITSVKLDDHIMLVKVPDSAADVSEQAGYSRVDYRKIVNISENMWNPLRDVFCEREVRENQLSEEARIRREDALLSETFLHRLPESIRCIPTAACEYPDLANRA